MFNLRVMNIHGVCSKGNVLFEGIAVCFLPMRRGLGRVARVSGSRGYNPSNSVFETSKTPNVNRLKRTFAAVLDPALRKDYNHYNRDPNIEAG